MTFVPTSLIVLIIGWKCWTDGQAVPVTQQEADQIVAMHNAARSSVSPSASNMMQISWDPQLAASAQAYANTCPSGHSGTKGVGENLSWGWPAMAVIKAITMWTDEKPFYTYASNSCQAGQQCGHYTQMVWAGTTKVGCGKRTCPNLMSRSQGDAWVCHYSPAGNWVGQKPYKTGSSCSQCPSGSACLRNMCQGAGSSGSLPGSGLGARTASIPKPAAPASSIPLLFSPTRALWFPS